MVIDLTTPKRSLAVTWAYDLENLLDPFNQLAALQWIAERHCQFEDCARDQAEQVGSETFRNDVGCVDLDHAEY